MLSKTELETLFNRIIKSTDETEVSRTLKEVEENNGYIQDKQLKSLLSLHDKRFKDQCIYPLNEFYLKYKEGVINDGDLQNKAALVDRDIRILESTIQFIEENKKGNELTKDNRETSKNGMSNN